jgi:hypothetical protein
MSSEPLTPADRRARLAVRRLLDAVDHALAAAREVEAARAALDRAALRTRGSEPCARKVRKSMPSDTPAVRLAPVPTPDTTPAPADPPAQLRDRPEAPAIAPLLVPAPEAARLCGISEAS